MEWSGEWIGMAREAELNICIHWVMGYVVLFDDGVVRSFFFVKGEPSKGGRTKIDETTHPPYDAMLRQLPNVGSQNRSNPSIRQVLRATSRGYGWPKNAIFVFKINSEKK